MKIICDCGNEVNLIEPNDNEERTYDEDKGAYVIPDDYGKIDIWEIHDVVGIVCRNCEKAVWMFV